MIEALAPGDVVTVQSMAGPERAEYLGASDAGWSLVRMADTGRRRRVRDKRLRRVGSDTPAPPRMERPAVTDAPFVGRPVPKDAPGRSDAYLAYVRARPCMSCAAPAPSDAHHWAMKGSGGGMGLKADDLRTVPLCRRCHDHFHAHGALPDMSVITTRVMFLAAQVDLLVRWKGER